MHPGAILVALVAAGAAATPVANEKRAMATVYAYETQVVTVTAGGDGYGYVPKRPHGSKHRHGHKPQHAPAEPSVYHPTPEPSPVPHKPKHKKPQAPTDNSYSGTVIRHHNAHRANHSAPAMTWDQGLADTAMKIAQTCNYAHNTEMDGGGYGQNIAAGVTPDNIGSVISDLFYNGEVNYYTYYGSEPSMDNFENWGHFSQVVWKASTRVACYTTDCSAQGLANVGSDVPPYFTVCDYRDTGNVSGEYNDNIGAPLGNPTADGSYSG